MAARLPHSGDRSRPAEKRPPVPVVTRVGSQPEARQPVACAAAAHRQAVGLQPAALVPAGLLQVAVLGPAVLQAVARAPGAQRRAVARGRGEHRQLLRAAARERGVPLQPGVDRT